MHGNRSGTAAVVFAFMAFVAFVADTRVMALPPKGKASEVSTKELKKFQARLLAATTAHLDQLIDAEKVTGLKGKSADGETALAFYQVYELTGNEKYRKAAVALAEQIVANMRETPHGVLYIKEKESGEETISGGGPPAPGWYASAAAYIFHKEGGRDDDIRYIATVIDNYPWNESGWWANTIDIQTGQPKVPITRAGAINKSAAMAMCSAIVSQAVKELDAELSARLKGKADHCIYQQIIPAQEDDGFWHYGFNGNDPKSKDVLGYFMVTAHELIQLQLLTGSYRDDAFETALSKACAFAARHIAPMTDPNSGSASTASHATPGTPDHYDLSEETKRGFQLGLLLLAGEHDAEAMQVMDVALTHFPVGDYGVDGAHAVHPSALMLTLLSIQSAGAKRK